MDERYSRLEKNKNLYISNDDHKFVVFYYFILLPIILIVSFFLLLTDVHATDSYVITNNVHPGQSCSGSTGLSKHICVRGNFSEGSYSAFEIGSNADTNASANIYAIQFYTYTSIAPTSYYTIKIEGTSFANTTYTCQLSTYTSSCRVVYVNSSRLNVNFTASGTTAVSNLQVLVTANNIFNTNSNWKVTDITLLSNPIDNTGSSGGTGGSSGSTFDDSGIIANQDANTQEIISNINNNINKTIDAVVNGLNTCYYNYFDIQAVGSNYTNTGSVERTGNRIRVITTNNINTDVSSGKTLQTLAPSLEVGSTYYLSYNPDGARDYIYLSGSNAVWYNNTNRIITQSDLDSIIVFYTSTKPSTGYYDNFMIQNSVNTISNHFVPFGQECTSKFDAIYDAQNETNDLIKDDSVDQSFSNSFFTDFDDTDNGGISAIITRPLMIINTLLDNNSSCANLQLPNIMGATNAYLPSGCILWNNAPSEVITLWNTLVIGLGSYFILRDLYKTIHDLKDPDNDKVEVMDL